MFIDIFYWMKKIHFINVIFINRIIKCNRIQFARSIIC